MARPHLEDEKSEGREGRADRPTGKACASSAVRDGRRRQYDDGRPTPQRFRGTGGDGRRQRQVEEAGRKKVRRKPKQRPQKWEQTTTDVGSDVHQDGQVVRHRPGRLLVRAQPGTGDSQPKPQSQACC